MLTLMILAYLYFATGSAILLVMLACDPGAEAALSRYPWRGVAMALLICAGWPVVLWVIWRRRTWRQ